MKIPLLCFSILITIIYGPICYAQDIDSNSDAAVKLADTARSVNMVRTSTPPVIDGKLDDEVWKEGVLIDNFKQVLPVEGASATEHTEIRILYDSRHIYFGIRCFDSNPDQIIAKQMSRDGNLGSDDRIMMFLDTFHDGRNAFFFEINPVGSKRDALLENGRTWIPEWDGIWTAKAGIDELGWTAEISIPFTTISFDPKGTIWGYQVGRTIRRKNESLRWANPSQDINFNNMAYAGDLLGIEKIEQGMGLDIKPYGLASAKYKHEENESGFDIDAGLDLFYKVSSSSTLAITINTDFAETEVDNRRINLTRFPLFFPEKRDFFLQDAGIFAFGGIRMNPLPFQSRRIGLNAAGEPQDILAGARLTGRESGMNYGVMSVQMKDTEELGNKNLSVGRISWNILDESNVGIIATSGDPSTTRDNILAGADFEFKNSKLEGNAVLSSNLWILNSWSSGDGGDDFAIGGKAGYESDRLRIQGGFTHIGDDFRAALGFVPRSGIREYFIMGRLRERPENSVIRTIEHSFFYEPTTDLEDKVESVQLRLEPFTIETNDGDEIEPQINYAREVLNDPFEISDGVTIPVGDYNWLRYGVKAETSDGRPIRVTGSIFAGDFYDGSRVDTEIGLEWRPSPYFFLGIGYEQNDIDLPDGDFKTRIGTLRANFYFTPDISWSNFVQYDNESETIGLNSRLRWILEPGNEFFIVLNQGFDVMASRFDPLTTELTTKVGWTFRF